MRYLSVCSGIEAASVAWRPLGWSPVAFSEIEPFPCAVLAHHYPNVPNWGDMTKFNDWPDATVDLLCGGTPCQSFSVAGLRKGLDDPRGSLMLTFGAIAAKYRPRWLVWENVPGVLSSNGGRDFGSFLGMLGQLGYGFAYRVLDAQYFGVAQRRRRVFVVGCLGDWRRAAAVLFERHSLSGHPAPRREAGQAAPTIPARSTGGGGLGTDFDCDGGLIHADPIARCLTTGEGSRQDWETCNFVAHTLRREGFGASKDGKPHVLTVVHGTQDPCVQDDMAFALGRNNGGENAVLEFQPGNLSRGAGSAPSHEVFPTLKADHGRGMSDQDPHVMAGSAVRRLTPRECERLQGFPDDYTAIPWRGKPADQCPDSPRYKALGNSWAVPVVRWIGERINAVEQIKRERKAA